MEPIFWHSKVYTVGIWNLDESGFWKFEKRLGCKWSRFQMGSEIRKPNHLKSEQMAPFCQKPFDVGTKTSWFIMVWLLNGWDYSIAKARPFKNRTIWNMTFKKSIFQMFPDCKWSDFRSPLCTISFAAALRLMICEKVSALPIRAPLESTKAWRP